jgi:mannose-1-phosphate guanylyltransferase
MKSDSHIWALVLAAGDGNRLRSLTTAGSGVTVPKQFCSLYEGPSLLHEALVRAYSVAAEDKTCVIVAEQHRRWWQQTVRSLPQNNVIVQARNRGTALGILLPLLHILSRDPQAKLVLLPSDHHVREESVLTNAMREALDQLDSHVHETILLGIQPQDLDLELGYIVPGASDGRGALAVERFVEKPSASLANELIRAGAFWNIFIIAARAQALLDLFQARFPEIVAVMRAALEADHKDGADGAALAGLYETLPVVDFSRDILGAQLTELRVLPVPPCGWSDLGTPKRVSETLQRSPPPAKHASVTAGMGYLSLALQHVRTGGIGTASAAR